MLSLLLRKAAGFEPAAPGAIPKRPKAARKPTNSDCYSQQRGIPRDQDATHARSAGCGEGRPLAVQCRQISAPGSRAPQGAPHQKLENTHHKREGERLPACEESPVLAGP